ncbi:MAG: VWA domain-containing protein [Pseudomonadota bacterium]
MNRSTHTVVERAGALWAILVVLGLVGLSGAGCTSGSGDLWGGGGGSGVTAADDSGGAMDSMSSDSTAPGEDVGIPGDSHGSCEPSCGGIQCGPDGCGGSCGWCSASQSCQGGQCVDPGDCVPDCGEKLIGEEDGCGGVCSGGGSGIGLKPGGAQDVGYFRLLVKNGEVPTPDLFPIEGFLNEHDTPLPAPDYDMFATLHGFLGLFYDPQVEEPLIAMQIGLNSGISPQEIEEKSFNLVVVVDESDSMNADGKIAMVRSGLLLLLDKMDDNDRLAIVTYSNDAEILMGFQATVAESKPMIADFISSIATQGSTNLFAGMVMGYELAENHKEAYADADALYRVMLLSDGVVTAGVDDTDVIVAKSAEYNQKGIGITTIGVGLDFNQELMYELANQGGGNFYFIQDAAKLMDVFIHEIEYLMTPVAENLKISFSLPQGFAVEEIYGYDWSVDAVTGEVKILAPDPAYSITDPDKPVNPGDPGPDPTDAEKAAATLFASKKNGLLMVKIKSLFPDVFASWQAIDFATIHYSYDVISDGSTESATKVVTMGSLSYFAEDGEGPLNYFSGPIMQRNFCILRIGLAIQKACEIVHGDAPDHGAAFDELYEAQIFCSGIQLALSTPDEAIVDDLELVTALHDNICALFEIDCQ